ncbi:unnamed protein product [Trichogramma brassicae]|uniref:Uncharacterized protein n=1 Tax=Trichogramma brassicae TaxID=86971 RepID=A0A6H5IA46_9HYME|nr:unnamed protein product [Trichogramma brassicae]
MDSNSQHSRTGGAKEGGKAEKTSDVVRDCFGRYIFIGGVYINLSNSQDEAFFNKTSTTLSSSLQYSNVPITLIDVATSFNAIKKRAISYNASRTKFDTEYKPRALLCNGTLAQHGTRRRECIRERASTSRLFIFICTQALKRALLHVYGPLEREHVIKYHFLNDIVMWRGREGSKCPRFVADGKSSTRKSIIDRVYYIRRTISKIRFKNKDVAQVRDYAVEISVAEDAKIKCFFKNDSCILHCKK